MTEDTLKWALIDTLRLLNRQPMSAAHHDEAERIAGTLGISIQADRHVVEPLAPFVIAPAEKASTLKLRAK